MRERILKLCKRLDKFTFEEILMIASDINESVLKLQLIKFVQEKRLIQRGDLYFYKKRTPQKNNSILLYYPAKTMDIIIRSFCYSIPGYKVSYILGIGEEQVDKIYNIFRNFIYDRQREKLFSHYNNTPQQCRNRIFYNIEVYFYVFENQIFVIEKPLNLSNEKKFTKSEEQEFKRVYSYLTRFVAHNSCKSDLFQKLAEGIWRRNKNIEELYNNLKANLKIF